jgi:FHA domain
MSDEREGRLPDVVERGTELVGYDRARTRQCASCGASNGAAADFCEHCGHELDIAVPHREWTLQVAVDREHFLRVAGDRDDFPAERKPRSMVLFEGETTIGRAEPAEGESPAMSLTGDLHDPGVSHRHALLVVDEDRLTITDVGSTNGTVVNVTPLVPGVAFELADGDRIYIGAWTAIVVGTERVCDT